MCGICGWSLAPGAGVSGAALERMSADLRHRGPDDQGVWEDPAAGVALAHRRLAIIDLTGAGHQPMAAEDGSAVLAFNGEIYNFLELRAELEALGHRFRGRSDTEVLLHAFRAWGIGCCERLRGMFAFAAWSRADATLYLARDPLGMKPLYCTELPGGRGVAFASEVKAFLGLPGFRARLDPHALVQFMEFGYVFDGERTSLEGVRKVLPGTWLAVRRGVAGPAREYYAPPAPDLHDGRSAEERCDELEAALESTVAQHLVADVPVGLLLSGGLDSSLLAALAARRGPLTTVTMAFAGSAVDERPEARAVARHIGSDHREVVISPLDLRSSLEQGAWWFDDLFADFGTISTRILYGKCRELGIKAVLVGEGADELFGGYPVFGAAAGARGPASWRLFLLYRRYAGRRWGRLFPLYRRIMRGFLARGGGDLFQAVRLFEARCQLPNNYVMKVDKASMSVGVEARTPFLDRRVADAAFRTPGAMLLRGGTEKALLRMVAERRGLLPPETARRPKFGASIAASWMEDSPELRAWAREIVLDPEGWAGACGLRGAMRDYFDRGRAGYRAPRAESVFSHLAWRLLLLNLWSRLYLATGAPAGA
jgi:asparagine synthase (glutamine-hydrolysing)